MKLLLATFIGLLVSMSISFQRNLPNKKLRSFTTRYVAIDGPRRTSSTSNTNFKIDEANTVGLKYEKVYIHIRTFVVILTLPLSFLL